VLALGRAHCRVIDGDTVVTASGEKIRLMGFDAPETRGECPRERAMAREATALLQRLAGSGLDLERYGRDRYGRTLAVARTPAGQGVVETLIGARLAHPYEGRGPRGGWCEPGR
jgi:endonuclease YncB( thermonuclease family)